ncbi:hypothetical protein KAFR_0I00130 [Kazachstania africana CBS 2517]|uniref:L-serine ammonia-lyase n=1 Tax=Kazachstania africana (strain ATCC 22294 / BCRC 22015 / CBS 2517 / CECT 1963 / NBRC 1671 / NRRL Y-8276) TaxID=1071382 RepID=H2AZJ4_KAZAF|nr:hypothetical protein KAFR_0I00130 [Kazachstania africana CBS 2517]CCF59794.1 hypothetical protein KAFR_0I00130 [Kazachstania africana CBS 2517]
MPIVYNKTPLVPQSFPGTEIRSSDSLPQVLIKYEYLQPSGSFKSRGIGNLVYQKALQIQKNSTKNPEVFSSSGGNAGYAAAVVAQKLSLPCTVVVPAATKQRMIEKIRSTGAKVTIHGTFWKGADKYMKNSVLNEINTEKVEPIYVHPSDDPLIWEGNSMIVDELMESLQEQKIDPSKVKAIVCSVGGGGLYNGLMQGLERYKLADKIPIVGVETDGSHVFNTCLKSGKHIEFEKISTVATSLGSASITKKTFEYAMKYRPRGVIVKDIEVLETCLRYTQDYNMITEPACGAAIHLAYHVDILEKALDTRLDGDDVVIIIACGGSSNSLHDMEETLKKMKSESQ